MKEYSRGYEHQEDLFSPGVFEIKLKEKESVIFRASLDISRKAIKKEWDEEIERVEALKKAQSKQKEPMLTLKASADVFIIENEKKEKGITAGYHWFGEWGRDTMISLAGITLCTGKPDTAMDILTRYAAFEKNGLLPNVLSDKGEHAYNSIDTQFYFFWAVQNYMKYSGKKEIVREKLLPVMKAIINAFIRNRVPNARVREDGFVYAGNSNTALTWMDAVAYGRPVTPRDGAAIEINALWYNALKFLLEEFGRELSPGLSGSIEKNIDAYEKNFIRAFYNENDRTLYDVYRGKDVLADGSIMPNQLFALGLPYTCIDQARAIAVLSTVQKHLVTGFGLRTLSPRDHNYKPDYRGDQSMRDSAYHQGVVWPWLIGIYCDAQLAFAKDKKWVKQHIEETFRELWTGHLCDYGLLHISELFKPDPPFNSKGCIAQAWSTAEVIRVLDRISRI